MKKQMVGLLENVLKVAIIVLVILFFELGFIRNGFYEVIAGFIRQYSRTISISLAALVLVLFCIRIFGGLIHYEEDEIKLNFPSAVSFSLIVLFAVLEISRIW